MKRLIIAVLSVFVLGSLYAHAHKGATGVVKQRMDSMKSIAGEMKKLKKQLFSGDALKVEEIKQSAGLIKKHAEETPALFPKGSTQHPSEAAKAIWKDWEGFKKIADELANYADALSVSVANESDPKLKLNIPDEVITDVEVLKKSAPQAAFFSLAKTCQDCHKAYRVKK